MPEIDPDHVDRLAARMADRSGLPNDDAAAAAKALLFAAGVYAEHAPHDQQDGSSANRFLHAAEAAAGMAGQIRHGDPAR